MDFLINFILSVLLILLLFGVGIGIYLLYIIHNIDKKLNENDD
jgi:hypothetical protein